MKIIYALIFSLIIHALILSLNIQLKEKNKEKETIENKIIARIIIKEDTLDKTTKDSTILSDKNNKVKKETISKNKSKKSPKKISIEDLSLKLDSPYKLSKKNDEKLQGQSIKKMKSASKSVDFSDGNFIDLNVELNKKIEKSSITQLNSAKYKYFSFFERMKKIIQNRWYSNINGSMFKIQYLPQGNYKNAFVMKIDKTGKLADLIFYPNGQKEVDDPALRIFEQSTIFHNPPKDIFGDKEFLYIKYTLNLQKGF